ncbi:tetratricopeptide repeat protein [Actinosynnema sp. NPDC047251]|uniref:Ternary complex associated domain-containing protein n=1 Tax=Saccharothrix espanaensis (strain ATCC 51144 / DSM 44229 / JCM 9112 / NBRC 15066 / NRRL 15764) TaxID=1179773 RepID=K0JV65_SACES|nr:tetratricopeptide repeat protein [Saccharothrix espanaensis]CCH31755.1 hypothetical protein BN6_44750 [Saccharothrix espanaensis DSM 44229]
MGRLGDREAWDELPEGVVDALEDWLAGQDFTLDHKEWFTDGRSGEPVARVLRRGLDDVDQLVLKFFRADGERRISNTQAAWSASKSFTKRLAKVERQALPLGDWRAVFLRVAGGNIATVGALTSLIEDKDFPDHCGTIVRSVVRDWNKDRTPMPRRAVADVLGDILRRRRTEVWRWAHAAGIAVDGTEERVTRHGWPGALANPFTLVADTAAGRRTHDFIVGKAHGDLNGRNILVPKEPTVDADSFVLIDYDRFATDAPLARDPMHLLVTLALDEFESFKASTRLKLSRVLVDPDADDVTPRYEYLRRLSAAVHESSAPKLKKGLGAEWRQQCLLSLVGAALMHLGRRIRTREEDAAKEWCFHLAATAAEAYQRTLGRAERVEPAVPPSALGSSNRELPGPLVDRKSDLLALRTRLSDGPWGVTVLRGLRGIGKTKLLDVALDGAPARDLGRFPARICRHETDAVARLDTGTLIDYVEGTSEALPAPQYGRSSLVRLEATLRRLGESPVVVAVDSAENLLDPDTGKLVDPDLDEALEMLATRPGHRVTVLLATQQELASPAAGTWPTAEAPLYLDKLPYEYFLHHLAGLDDDSRWDHTSLPEQTRRALYDRMQGNPRYAELAHAVVAVAKTAIDLRALAALLAPQPRKSVPGYLTGLLLEGLAPAESRVLHALAALDTPVPDTAVVGLLGDVPPDDVRRALSTLVAGRVIRRAPPDQYVIPAQDARLVLDHLPSEEARGTLYFLAATQLTFLQNNDPRSVEDLRVHFAELTALLRGRKHASAYNVIELIHDVLSEWNAAHLLLKPRQEVRGRLGDDHLELANHNALAIIYTTYGRFDEAASAYGRAFALATARRDEISQAKIRVNLAALYWQWSDTNRALGYFELARDDARRLDDPVILMGALEGIADCDRRQGRYEDAVRHAVEALELPRRPDYPDTRSARDHAESRGVALMLKLARWFGERGDAVEATRYVELAKLAATELGGSWLRTSCLDGRATLLVHQGEFELAQAAALTAVDEALRHHDPVTLLQARTTLCLVYLKTGRREHAWSEIEQALPYRTEGRSLVVLALLGLASYQKGDRATASRRFRALLDESTARTALDGDDFAAWDFRGYALCGLHLVDGADLAPAVEVLGRTRRRTPPALVDRLRFLIGELDDQGLLGRALDAL